VWAYYLPSFVASAAFVPVLLIMSAAKFAIVVLFYMHLKYDHKLFKALFTGPLMIAMATLISLLFLFGKFVKR
jgi:cytochrome c oxidase subunit IV